jgi:enoyl-CoA hydratase/carnithine racemase
MDLYSKDQLTNALSETYAFLEVQQSGQVLTIRLNRAEKKNALHPHMVNELAFAMSYAKHEKSVWAVVLEAKGDVFCAGADLKAFMGGDTNFTSTIPEAEWRSAHRRTLQQGVQAGDRQSGR